MAKYSTFKVFTVLLVLLVLMHLKNWIRWEKQLGKEKITQGIIMPNIEKELPNVPPRHSLQQNRYWKRKDKESAAQCSARKQFCLKNFGTGQLQTL